MGFTTSRLSIRLIMSRPDLFACLANDHEQLDFSRHPDFTRVRLPYSKLQGVSLDQQSRVWLLLSGKLCFVDPRTGCIRRYAPTHLLKIATFCVSSCGFFLYFVVLELSEKQEKSKKAKTKKKDKKDKKSTETVDPNVLTEHFYRLYVVRILDAEKGSTLDPATDGIQGDQTAFVSLPERANLTGLSMVFHSANDPLSLVHHAPFVLRFTYGSSAVDVTLTPPMFSLSMVQLAVGVTPSCSDAIIWLTAYKAWLLLARRLPPSKSLPGAADTSQLSIVRTGESAESIPLYEGNSMTRARLHLVAMTTDPRNESILYALDLYHRSVLRICLIATVLDEKSDIEVVVVAANGLPLSFDDTAIESKVEKLNDVSKVEMVTKKRVTWRGNIDHVLGNMSHRKFSDFPSSTTTTTSTVTFSSSSPSSSGVNGVSQSSSTSSPVSSFTSGWCDRSKGSPSPPRTFDDFSVQLDGSGSMGAVRDMSARTIPMGSPVGILLDAQLQLWVYTHGSERNVDDHLYCISTLRRAVGVATTLMSHLSFLRPSHLPRHLHFPSTSTELPTSTSNGKRLRNGHRENDTRRNDADITLIPIVETTCVTSQMWKTLHTYMFGTPPPGKANDQPHLKSLTRLS